MSGLGRSALISIALLWATMLAAVAVISPIYDAFLARITTPLHLGYGWVGLFSPEIPIFYGFGLTVLFAFHWWLSGLLGKGALWKHWPANIMLALSVFFTLAIFAEEAAHHFYDFSVLCRAGEPTSVILVDETYQCVRSRMVLHALNWSVFLLPILAIPVRIAGSKSPAKPAGAPVHEGDGA
ncbi:hypothetical protein AAG604_14325 [Citromicrobium bathyomarinum]